MIKKACLAILFMAVCTLTVSAQNADAILGKWLSPTSEGQIQIYKKGSKFFGKLVWMKVPDEDGKPKLDKFNPDPTLRSRPKLNLEILKDFVYDGDNVYEGGTIYDPQSGKTYSCKMTLKGDILKVRGYMGISLLGRTENFSRIK
ncbi:DUF2147 domain-containing protein [Mucilaginibacter glaciei]|uniref:DUF2147 domain-containing protein n=1 Tax=Mucilaginibacter glaciei TaxID=2772109 RepID=A0A926NTA6_9SPHI|nr:DUF2147 domain-containing protein [Mucilaginibacter glaciei]MBD1394622.1 DUF2147 domain-containing protein [Mucilaginibacter glaciei]